MNKYKYDEKCKTTPTHLSPLFDEAGDATFYGKGRIPILGNPGVSNVFMLGMVRFDKDLGAVFFCYRSTFLPFFRQKATDFNMKTL